MCEQCGKTTLDYSRRTIYFSVIDSVFDSKMVHKTLKQPADAVDSVIDGVSTTIDGHVTAGSFHTSAKMISHKTYRRFKSIIYLASSVVYDMVVYPMFKDKLRQPFVMKMCLCEFYSSIFTIIAEQIYCIWYQGGFSSYTLLNDVIAVFGADWIDKMLMKQFPNVPIISDGNSMLGGGSGRRIPMVPEESQEGQGQGQSMGQGLKTREYVRKENRMVLGKSRV